MPLILEKITQPSPSAHVSRSRLLGLLRESLSSCSSTVVSGRAGTGKTTLVADFARECRRAVAWYKVDSPDGDLRVFFDYLIAGIQRQRPDFGRQSLAPLLTKGDGDGVELLAEAFVYELLEGKHEPLLIVIEDLHLVCDAHWVVTFFRRLLPLLPGDVHVLITSRTLPPAPLWRMRSKQSLSVIDENTLAFTRAEAVELFASYGLSREQASIALDHTHGRAAALEACAESLSQVEKPSPNASLELRPQLSN
jgi:LuxR family transcriptional regulator, maltose regulon positive regulatory protein